MTFFGPETSKTIPETKKLAMQTADASNNGGPNSFRIAQYRKAGMIKEGASIYFQFIKVGTSKASVGG